ncbi:MAG TPA: thioredoxin family protein [Vicinamibacterales bacterium]|jgi:thioredoxin-like negative regulator of GroEL|nr:thioredoxin family protein [Vicinamibacterales bacterium]
MAPPAIFVFIQAGCSACHDYMPKFERVRSRYPRTVVGVYDLAKPDRYVQRFAEVLNVRATPTTVVQTSGGAQRHHEGSLPVAQIEQLFRSAV